MFRQARQIEQHVGGRVTSADHQDGLASISVSVTAKHVRKAIGSMVGKCCLAIGRHTARPQGLLVQVPEASITARARSRRVLPSAPMIDRTNGFASRPQRP